MVLSFKQLIQAKNIPTQVKTSLKKLLELWTWDMFTTAALISLGHLMKLKTLLTAILLKLLIRRKT